MQVLRATLPCASTESSSACLGLEGDGSLAFAVPVDCGSGTLGLAACSCVLLAVLF
jgi:hypothetical protein